MAAVTAILALADQILYSWIKVRRDGRREEPRAKRVS